MTKKIAKKVKKYNSEKRKLFHKIIGNIAIRLFNLVLDEKSARRYVMDTSTITQFIHKSADHIERLGWVGNENSELEDILIMIDDILAKEFRITPAKNISTAGQMLHWLANHAEAALYKQDLYWKRNLFSSPENWEMRESKLTHNSRFASFDSGYKSIIGVENELQR